MAQQEFRWVLVRTGTWWYAGEVAKPVEVFGLTYDFFHELGKADGDLEPWEEPQPLGEDGLLYYHRFRDAGSGFDTAPWPESLGTETVAAAMAEAEARVPGIVWDPPAARR